MLGQAIPPGPKGEFCGMQICTNWQGLCCVVAQAKEDVCKAISARMKKLTCINKPDAGLQAVTFHFWFQGYPQLRKHLVRMTTPAYQSLLPSNGANGARAVRETNAAETKVDDNKQQQHLAIIVITEKGA
jgi:hypothetical protein